MDEVDVYPHINAEFFAWLLYRAEMVEGSDTIDIDGFGSISLIIQDRLSFQDPSQEKDRTVVTGSDAASSAETRVALASGKALQDVRMMLTVEEVPYLLTLKGDSFDISGLKQAKVSVDTEGAIEEEDEIKESLLLLSMQEYEVIWSVVEKLFEQFVEERIDDSWYTETLQEMRRWVHELD